MEDLNDIARKIAKKVPFKQDLDVSYCRVILADEIARALEAERRRVIEIVKQSFEMSYTRDKAVKRILRGAHVPKPKKVDAEQAYVESISGDWS